METIEAAPIGRRGNVDVTSYTIPIIGYDLKGNEVITKIRFLRRPPFGFVLDMMRDGFEPGGDVRLDQALKYVDACVHSDDEEMFEELLHSKKIEIEWNTISEIYRELGRFYSSGGKGTRPTKRPRNSSAGRTQSKKTSTVAASKPTSVKKTLKK